MKLRSLSQSLVLSTVLMTTLLLSVTSFAGVELHHPYTSMGIDKMSFTGSQEVQVRFKRDFKTSEKKLKLTEGRQIESEMGKEVYCSFLFEPEAPIQIRAKDTYILNSPMRQTLYRSNFPDKAVVETIAYSGRIRSNLKPVSLQCFHQSHRPVSIEEMGEAVKGWVDFTYSDGTPIYVTPAAWQPGMPRQDAPYTSLPLTTRFEHLQRSHWHWSNAVLYGNGKAYTPSPIR